MRSKLLFLIMLILTMTALPGIVQAEQLVARSEYTVESIRGADPYEQGTWFTTGDTAPTVAALGFLDLNDSTPGGADGDGLQEAHTVNLWLASDSSLVTSVEIPAGTVATLNDGYRWVTVTGGTITLEANTEYVVSSDTTGMIDDWFDAEAVTLDPYFIGTNDNTTYGYSWGGAGTQPAGGYAGSCYGLVNISSSSGAVSNPTPANGSSLPAPDTITLKWEHLGLGTSDVYWNAGNNDVNSINFQYHIDNTTGKVIQIGFDVDDPNEVTGVAIVVEKNYYWRVDNGGKVGPVWNFTTINQAPTVDAGLKQALWLPSGGGSVTFDLAPAVTDDPLPQPHILTYTWTATDPCNPGVVTFTPPGATTSNDPAPTASMSVAGDYIIDLEVSDGDDSGYDWVKLRVHANATTGLEARYDCEEVDTGTNIHDDYSGYDRNPPPAPVVNPPSRRGERMDAVGLPGNNATTIDETHGHSAQPEQLPGDTTKGGIVYNGFGGHIWTNNSNNGDPNYNPWSNWPGPSWADLQDEVTLAAWIRVAVEGGWSNAWETIISKGYDSAANDGAYALWRNNEGDGVQMAAYGVNNWASGTIPVNDGNWHHVVGTYDGAYMCVYVDSIEDVCVETDGAQINMIGIPLTFGDTYERDDAGDFSSYAPFNGMMDEIRIHSIGLPHASDSPEAAPLDGNNARSVRSIYRTSNGHPNCGTNYLDGDANEDCYVNLVDVEIMAQTWLECNSISEGRCDKNTDKP